jgi:hypothetical protein
MTPEAIARIHNSGKRCVIAVTGGGSEAIARLLAVPGASRFLLEARVPYCTAALDEFLGARPEQYCSDRTARAIAMAAYWRATKLAGSDALDDAGQWIGLGATASLASDRPKRGRHRLHAALQTARYTACVSLTLVSGRRTRADEESLAADLLLAFLADATSSAFERAQSGPANPGASLRIHPERCEALAQFHAILATDDFLDGELVQAPAEWTRLLLGQTGRVACEPQETPESHFARDLPAKLDLPSKLKHVAIQERSAMPDNSATPDNSAMPDNSATPDDSVKHERSAATTTLTRALFPGAFHPLHAGHRAIARWAAEQLGRAVEFELSIENVDKPPLDFIEIAARAGQFAHTGRLWLTRAPTFLSKARLFPNTVFLVGADTVLRVAVARYYPDVSARDAAIDEIRRQGCRFLVFGRVANGQFQSLADLDLPPNLAALCDEVPESAFRADISSTEIRRGIANLTDPSASPDEPPTRNEPADR